VRRWRLILTAVFVMTMMVLASGCAVSSGRATYSAHTAHQLKAGAPGSTDLAMAFGLDGNRRAAAAVAHAESE